MKIKISFNRWQQALKVSVKGDKEFENILKEFFREMIKVIPSIPKIVEKIMVKKND